ncbi:hypothetical protein FB45DRAFT_1091043 [Roridomyces roridus]|uniref:Uncharacterized protein n=1 Tax=Roridomyces roridus TaxID=1738132 RepID=A0AAD7BIT3_9AGAR|nr:hypothetical protein FB45DRAFT_1091043 [Roridomyces roridus]
MTHSLLRLEPAGLRWVCVLPSPPPKVDGSRTASVRPDHVWLPMTECSVLDRDGHFKSPLLYAQQICPSPVQYSGSLHESLGSLPFSRHCLDSTVYQVLVCSLAHLPGSWALSPFGQVPTLFCPPVASSGHKLYTSTCSPDQSSPLTSPHPPHHQWLSATFPYLPECQLNHPDSDCHAKQWPLKAGSLVRQTSFGVLHALKYYISSLAIIYLALGFVSAFWLCVVFKIGLDWVGIGTGLGLGFGFVMILLSAGLGELAKPSMRVTQLQSHKDEMSAITYPDPDLEARKLQTQGTVPLGTQLGRRSNWLMAIQLSRF